GAEIRVTSADDDYRSSRGGVRKAQDPPVYSRMFVFGAFTQRRVRLLVTLAFVVPLVACAPPGVVGATKPVLPEPLREQPYPRPWQADVTVTSDECRSSFDEATSLSPRVRLELVGDP